MTDELSMVFEAEPALSDENYVRTQIGLWNIKVTGYDDYAPANFILRDAGNEIRGGILAYVWAKWLHVDILWLQYDVRRQGWGTKLMEAAHTVGREKGAEAAWLDTSAGKRGRFTSASGMRPCSRRRTSRPGTHASSCKRSPCSQKAVRKSANPPVAFRHSMSTASTRDIRGPALRCRMSCSSESRGPSATTSTVRASCILRT